MGTWSLQNLLFHSGYAAFKNNSVYTGSFNISGTANAGVNTQTFTLTLPKAPDLADILFNAPTDTVFGNDPRPSAGWFKQGASWVIGNNAGAGFTNYPTPWVMSSRFTGSQIVITAQYVQTFTAPLTLNTTAVSYRIVDYSVF